MPAAKDKNKVVDRIRQSEYYEMQDTFDSLYRKSLEGETFDDLMKIILSKENILLAYKNMKRNRGSQTPGPDKLTIDNIGQLSSEEVVEYVRFIMIGSKHGYRPKPVRRKEIPKVNGKVRPLGIPCIWDRFVQQCIKQVIEPICEAKFSKNSYGFRPNRCAEHAIAETHRLMQRSKLGYAVEIEFEDFFEKIDHSKLKKQIWSLGIRDKKLMFIIMRILKTPVRFPNGDTVIFHEGILQGGILTPVLTNIVLNEFDHWIDSQWLEHPMIDKFKLPVNRAGKRIKSDAYAAMRKTNLKEMYIIRYAEDVRIFCRSYSDACRVKAASIQWIKQRLRLDVSQEHTRIVNLRHGYMEFLGFKLKLYDKGNGWKVKSHVNDRKLSAVYKELKHQFAKIAHAKNKAHTTSIVRRYNSMVLASQNYYHVATDICKDFRLIQYQIDAVAKSRLHVKNRRISKLSKEGRRLTEFEKDRYGNSKAMRYIKASGEPIYPIGFVNPKPPISKSDKVCIYTPEGRKGIDNNIKIDMAVLIGLMRNPSQRESAEFNDNKLSLYSLQKGRCAITKRVFKNIGEIHCHHIYPKKMGGTDECRNLMLVLDTIHKLIHAQSEDTIMRYLKNADLTGPQIKKVNKYRMMVGNQPIMNTN